MAVLNGSETLDKISEDVKIEQIVNSLEEHLHKNLSATRDILQNLSTEERNSIIDWCKAYHQLTLDKVSELIKKYSAETFYEGL